MNNLDDLYVKSPELVTHSVNELTAVYHRKLGGLCLLDEGALEVLESFERPQRLPERSVERKSRRDRLLEQLLGRCFVVKVSTDEGEKPHPVTPVMPRINVIQLVMVNGCNFGCTYCFEGRQGADLVRSLKAQKPREIAVQPRDEVTVSLEDSVYASEERNFYQQDPNNRWMSPESAVKYVETALDLAHAAKVPNVMIQFFGGEPLLNPRAVLAVLENIGNGQKFGLEVEYTIVTNGSLITDEIARKFAQYRVGVCVSFDSPNSPARPLKNGQSSVPLVLKGLKKLREYDNRVVLNTALCGSTFDSVNESLIEFAASCGINEIGVVLDLDPTFYSKFGSEKIAQKVSELVEIGKSYGVVVTG